MQLSALDATETQRQLLAPLQPCPPPASLVSSLHPCLSPLHPSLFPPSPLPVTLFLSHLGVFRPLPPPCPPPASPKRPLCVQSHTLDTGKRRAQDGSPAAGTAVTDFCFPGTAVCYRRLLSPFVSTALIKDAAGSQMNGNPSLPVCFHYNRAALRLFQQCQRLGAEPRSWVLNPTAGC